MANNNKYKPAAKSLAMAYDTYSEVCELLGRRPLFIDAICDSELQSFITKTTKSER